MMKVVRYAVTVRFVESDETLRFIVAGAWLPPNLSEGRMDLVDEGGALHSLNWARVTRLEAVPLKWEGDGAGGTEAA